MSSTALGLMIGKTLVLAITKAWLGEGVAQSLFENVFDWGADKAQQRPDSAPIDAALAGVARNLKPVFEKERSGLDDEACKRVIRAIGETIAHFDTSLVVKVKLNAKTLTLVMKSYHPDATRLLPENETALYNRMLDEICVALVKISNKLPDFDYEWTSSVLKDQDRLLKLVDGIWELPNIADTEFEKKYRHCVYEELDKVDFLGIGKIDDITRRQSLSISYVALNVIAQEKLGYITSEDELESNSNQETGSRNVTRVLAKGKRFVITGEAGSGKTTLLHWLAVRAAKQDFEPPLKELNDLVPFVIHLREYVKEENCFPCPEEFPCEVADLIVGSMPVGWVHRKLEIGRALILIDGIDEIRQEQRENVLEQLNKLLKLYPFVFYFISSRPTALKDPKWQGWFKDNGFIEAAFSPMDLQQIEVMIKKWHTALHEARLESESESAKLGDKLIRIINRRIELQRLSENPLLCAMLCALHLDRRDNLPGERRQLYKECIEVLLERRDVKRDIASGLSLNLEAKLKLIRYLAYWMLDNQTPRLEIEEVDIRFAQKLLALSKSKGITGEDIRRFFVERSNLLREPGAGQIEFVHRSFQEYLAAQYAVLEERNFKVLIKNAIDDLWREVIILAIGETSNKKDRDFLLKGLLKRAEKIENHDIANRIYLIAAIGLEQCAEISSEEIEQSITQAVADVIPPLSQDIELLASVGDRAVAFLGPNQLHNEGETVNCIKTLAKIGSEEALSKLEMYAEDKRLAIRVALGFAWDSFDRCDYAMRILSKGDTLIKVSVHDSFEGFEYLNRLKDLRIFFDSNLKDIRQLSSCKELIKLSLCWEKLDSLDVIASLKQLKELSIGILEAPQIIGLCKSTLTDLMPIKLLENLNHLDICDTGVQDLNPLSSMRKLNKLSVMGTEIQDLTPLSNLTQLSELGIGMKMIDEYQDGYWWVEGRNKVNNLSPLSALINLKKLTIGHTHASIEPLKNLTSLLFLGLSKNGISDLSPLEALQNLEILRLEEKLIKEISILDKLVNLKELFIDGSMGITDLSPLKALTKLKKLQLSECWSLGDLTPISELPNLTTIAIKNVATCSLPLGDISHPMDVFFEPGSGEPEFRIGNVAPNICIERDGPKLIAKYIE